MSLLSILLYIPLQIVCLPLAIAGGLYVAYCQIVRSKKLGVSMTAIEVLNGRWTLHVFGIRRDPACARLAQALPNTSVAGLWLTLGPLWLKYKCSGELFVYPRVPAQGDEDLRDLIVARTLYFDEVIERVTPQVEQWVLMGAGYDTRAYGDLATRGVRIFELDQPVVQQHKIQGLRDAGIAHDHVRFVPVDFNQDSAFEQLDLAGFDPGKKTLFLWEGVTLYLSEANVRKTMAEVREHAPAGSVLLADMYAADFVQKLGGSRGTKEALAYTNEGMEFGLDFAEHPAQQLANFVESESMSVGASYFMGEHGKNGPFMVVVEMQLL